MKNRTILTLALFAPAAFGDARGASTSAALGGSRAALSLSETKAKTF
jgi:hypothetical protein